MLCPNCHKMMLRFRSTPLEDEYHCSNVACDYSVVVYRNGQTKQNNSQDISGSPQERETGTDGPKG
jgi:hypothetical protein